MPDPDMAAEPRNNADGTAPTPVSAEDVTLCVAPVANGAEATEAAGEADEQDLPTPMNDGKEGEPITPTEAIIPSRATSKGSAMSRLAAGPVMEIPRDELDMKTLIGKGAWGKVYRGYWLSAEVAMKRLNKDLTEEAKAQFMEEVRVSAALKHPHIIQVYGGCTEGEPMMMVMEYMPHGSLFKLMKGLIKDRKKPGCPFPMFTAVDMIMQITRGMMYLHKRGITHRDLKSLNVLVAAVKDGGQQYTVKIGDFGLAKVKNESMTMLNTQVGTFRWMAPEVMRGETYRASADVYGFAMLSYEILTGEVPYQDLIDVQVTFAVAHEKVRPELPSYIPAEVRQLLTECWADDPAVRPTFEQIQARLKPVHAHLQRELKAERAKMAEVEATRSREELQMLQQLLAVEQQKLDGEKGGGGALAPPASVPLMRGGSVGDGLRLSAGGANDRSTGGSSRRAQEMAPGAGRPQDALTVMGHDDWVLSLAIAGDTLFSGGADNSIKVWNLKRRSLLTVLKGHTGWVRTLAIGAGRLFSGSYDHTIKVWRLKDLKLEATLNGHRGGILGIAVAGSHNKLFSCADDKTIRVWSLQNYAHVATMRERRGEDWTHSLMLATRDGDARLFSGSHEGFIKEWELKRHRWWTLPWRRHYRPMDNPLKAHSRPICAMVVAKGHLYSGSWDGTVKAWDVYTHELVATMEGHTEYVFALAVGTNVLCSASADATIRIWSLVGYQLLSTLSGHTADVFALATKNGSIYSGSKDNTIRVWDGL